MLDRVGGESCGGGEDAQEGRGPDGERVGAGKGLRRLTRDLDDRQG